ncbi:tetratricopeptide repeat protein [Burkholderia stabilis]|uniref:PEP-CTERM system TPR-repeat lipoprotein,Tetratricopeptide repeat n=1 Tax=Burkholderia stabilis TaxID=95485 RepID=A0AAJ5N5F2_9BURK|nr:tetratricopeptide repeat protein [Burkholderia stabilis]VBB11919.1 putative PEP-CTERM system TPR-repeat lipoprotein,Tetratricopeptide repeat [Burkholderia stabilis]
MKDRLFAKLSGVVVACGVIAGCASQPPAPPTAEVFNKSLADADAVAKAGDQDKALGLYQQLAKSDPTREEPWSRIAQIQFAQNHYGQAIVAAQEALQRDATDRQAKSVLAVAGLRIATQSLGELRQDSSLAGDAKSDAQALAKQLRDTLGESALFPPEQRAVKPRPPRRVVHRPKGGGAAPATEAAATATATTPTTAPQKGSADPFGALRN